MTDKEEKLFVFALLLEQASLKCRFYLFDGLVGDEFCFPTPLYLQ